MNCDEALILISGELDGTNTEDEMAQLRAHLETCPECRRVIETLKQLDLELANLEAEPPADLKDHVMDAIRAEAKPKQRRHRWLPFAVSAAAVFLMIGVAQTNQIRNEDSALSAVSETAAPAVYSRAIHDIPAPDTDNDLLLDNTHEVDSQQLANERGAAVVTTCDLLPEMEICPCETLEDGSLLYHLETADAAAALSKKYGLELVQPENGYCGEISFARLIS